jgi:hypothetical protein
MANSPPKLDYSPPDARPSVWVRVIVRVLVGIGVAAVIALLFYAALVVYFLMNYRTLKVNW